MATAREHTLTGTRGTITAREWGDGRPGHVVILVHGYGEHIGRYEHVADALVRGGAAVFGPDHAGHGKSQGERVLVEDFEDVVTDVRTVEQLARAAHPELPVVVVGHSMGGLIAARHAQRYGEGLAGLVLSGPVLGDWKLPGALLAFDELPDIPIDPATLSRDPAVGKAYAADPLVWHGPFRRRTLQSFVDMLSTVDAGGDLGPLPTLWIHGGDDRIVPLDGTRAGIERLRGSDLTEHIRPGARHEVLNETDRDEVLAVLTEFVRQVVSR
ncbi:alpha/beta hydrolase [Streptomyces sp. NPDC002004]